MTAIITDALRAAIDMVEIERQSFADCNVRHDGTFDRDDLTIVREYDDVLAKLRAALHEAERAEQVEPVAYRVEIRWRDRALDQSWRKYADTAYQDSAISLRDSENNMETESRIIPLYAGEPEQHTNTKRSRK